MTKDEFLHLVPHQINHISFGIGDLEIITDSTTLKGICYRHENQFASGGTYGKSWAEVYSKLKSSLIKHRDTWDEKYWEK